MRSGTLDFLVGLVFFAAMGLLGFVTIFKAQRFGQTKFFRVTFPKVYGLKEGSPVRCEGKDVGEVRLLRLVEDYVEAHIEVSADVQIYKVDYRIAVTPFSPLGGRVVEINRGRAGNAEFKSADKIEGLASLDPIKGDAEGELISVITELIQENRKKIDEIVENVRFATTRLRENDNLIGKALNDKTLADDVGAVASNLNRGSKSLENVLARVDKGEGVVGALTREEDPFTKDVRAIGANTRELTAELRDVGKALNKGEGAIPKLISDKKTGDKVEKIVSDVEVVTDTLAQKRGLVRLATAEADPIFEDVKETAKNLREISASVNDRESPGPIGVLVSDAQSGEDLKAILSNLGSASKKLNDPDAGVVGAILADKELNKKTRLIFDELGRTLKEFRDSLEDVREQAPVNAFIGTVFSAF